MAECLRELLRRPDASYQLLPPAAAAVALQLEHEAGGAMPTELRELYQLSNGIAEYLPGREGEEPLPIGSLLLSAEEAAAENRRIQRQPATPTEAALLVVAPTYIGGWFGYRRVELPAASAALYVWQPVEDELEKVANSLPELLLGWAEGRIII